MTCLCAFLSFITPNLYAKRYLEQQKANNIFFWGGKMMRQQRRQQQQKTKRNDVVTDVVMKKIIINNNNTQQQSCWWFILLLTLTLICFRPTTSLISSTSTSTTISPFSKTTSHQRRNNQFVAARLPSSLLLLTREKKTIQRNNNIPTTSTSTGTSSNSIIRYASIGTETCYYIDDNHHHHRCQRRLQKRLSSSSKLYSSSSSNNNNNNNQQEEETSSNSSSSQHKEADGDESNSLPSEEIQLNGDISSSSSEESSSLSSPPPLIPSYKQLAVFVATTILIWVSEPLLSLVDTGIVGIYAPGRTAVIQLAALGPATTMYDSAVYMTYFLAIAATNTLAPGLAKKDWKLLRKQTSHLMGLAASAGLIVTIIVFGFGTQMMTSMAGQITHTEIIPLATTYAKIRAAVAPFCVVDFVAQAFCLTTLDTITPAIAVAVASLVNVVGDLLLVPKFGIQGAAIATAVATVSSCLILTNKVRKTTNQWKQRQKQQEENQTANTITQVVNGTVEFRRSSQDDSDVSAAVSSSSSSSSSAIKDVDNNNNSNNKIAATMMKKDNIHDVPFLSLPDKKSVIDLLMLAGPIFFIMMMKIMCYSVMTIRATGFGIVPLASHTLMMRVFFFFACAGDALSQAGQTFFPRVAAFPKERKVLFKRLLYLSGAIGLCISNLSTAILGKFGSYLTKDTSIITCMAQYAPWVGLAVFLHPFLMLVEGYIMGAKRDLKFLVGMYAATTAIHFGFTFSPISASFQGLWRAFFAFQAIRLTQLSGRLFFQNWRTKKGGPQTNPQNEGIIAIETSQT